MKCFTVKHFNERHCIVNCFLRVAESGDLAIAAHHSLGTDSDANGDGGSVVISDNGGSDEESSKHEVHHVPTRRQLAEQRSRRELFRRPRNHFKTSEQQRSGACDGAARRHSMLSCWRTKVE